jgi:proteic killer suppression protein
MIRSFRSKGLEELWRTGTTKKIDRRMLKRIMRRLEALDVAERPQNLNIAGFDFHRLSNGRYSLHVNGPWCVTFEFERDDAYRVDYEQYH